MAAAGRIAEHTTARRFVVDSSAWHWSADRDEVQDFEYTIQGKLRQGQGLLRGRLPVGDRGIIQRQEQAAGCVGGVHKFAQLLAESLLQSLV